MTQTPDELILECIDKLLEIGESLESTNLSGEIRGKLEAAIDATRQTFEEVVDEL